MEQQRSCLCCGTKLNEQLTNCPYCGLAYIWIADEATRCNYENNVVAAYRTEKVASLTGFNTSCYKYDVKNNRLQDAGRQTVTIGNGIELAKGIVWSKESFAQCHDNPRPFISINYKAGSTPKALDLQIGLPNSKDFWRLGLEITPSLHLRAYLGEPGKSTSTKDIPLDIL